jgi:hypothetical protein
MLKLYTWWRTPWWRIGLSRHCYTPILNKHSNVTEKNNVCNNFFFNIFFRRETSFGFFCHIWMYIFFYTSIVFFLSHLNVYFFKRETSIGKKKLFDVGCQFNNKTLNYYHCHNITEILLKVALKTITLNP